MSNMGDRGERFIPPAMPIPPVTPPPSKPADVENDQEAGQDYEGFPDYEMPEVNVPSFPLPEGFLPKGFDPLAASQAFLAAPPAKKAMNLIRVIKWASILGILAFLANDVFTAWMVHLFK